MRKAITITTLFAAAHALAQSDPSAAALHSPAGTGSALTAPVLSEQSVTVTPVRQPAGEENLLPNGGLESDAGWSLMGSANLFAPTTDGPAEGVRAVGLRTAPNPHAVTALRSQPIDLADRRPLIFSGQFRVQGGLAAENDSLSQAGVLVQWLGAGGSQLSEQYALTLNGAFEHWHRLMRRLTPPAGAQQMRLVVGAMAGPSGAPPLQVFVDDLRLRREQDFLTAPSAAASGETSSGDIRVSSHAETQGSATKLSLTVSTTADHGGAALVRVSLPLSGGEWHYHPDLIRSLPLGAAGSHAWSVSADRSGDLPLSIAPMAAVSSANETIGFVVPPTSVAIHEFHCTTDSTPRFNVDFPVGVIPGRDEHLELWIHRGAATWGARGVYAQHLEMHPEHFVARGAARREMNAGTALPEREVNTPDDFGFGFVQSEDLDNPDRAARALESAAAHHVLIAQYILPWADEPTVSAPNAPSPTLAECLAAEAAGAGEEGTRRALRIAGSKSRVLDPAGDPIVTELLQPAWRNHSWVIRLPMDLSTEIDGGRGAVTLDAVKRAAEIAQSASAGAPGIVMDNFMMDSDQVLIDDAHLRACRGPLTFSPNTLQPAAPLAENHVRWLKALSEAAGERIIAANVLRAGVAQFGLPYLDAFDFECRAAREIGRSENWRLEDLAWRRALAVQRPVAAMVSAAAPRGENWTPQSVAAFAQEIWARCLVFAITPTILDAWREPAAMEAVRPIYQQYTPLVRRLEAAGWEPVTGATIEGSGFIAERYGRAEQGEVLLAIYNAADQSASAQITIDWQALGLTAPAEVQELVGGQSMAVTGGNITFAVDARRTALLLLSEK